MNTPPPEPLCQALNQRRLDSPVPCRDDFAAERKGFVPRAARNETFEINAKTERGPMTTAPVHAPEIKSADAAHEATRAFEEFARAFDAFKDENDARLAEIETRLSADVVREEKLARIDEALDQARARLDRVALDARRPALGGAASEPRDPHVHEHKAAFDLYVRSGEAAGLKRLEAKALSAGSGPDGGYLVPDTIEREVLQRLARISPIRAIASVRTISGGLYKRAFSTTGFAAGWVGETAPGRRPRPARSP